MTDTVTTIKPRLTREQIKLNLTTFPHHTTCRFGYRPEFNRATRQAFKQWGASVAALYRTKASDAEKFDALVPVSSSIPTTVFTRTRAAHKILPIRRLLDDRSNDRNPTANLQNLLTVTQIAAIAALPFSIHRSVHRSHTSPDKFAYYQSWAKFLSGTQTIVSPAKYLSRLVSLAPHLDTPTLFDQTWITRIAKRMAANGAPGELVLKSIDNGTDNTPSDIDQDTLEELWVTAYKRPEDGGVYHQHDTGNTSCMEGEDCVRVYALKGNGLRLLYWETPAGDRVGRTIATYRNEYVRLYPGNGHTTHPFNHAEGTRLLELAGYKHNPRALKGFEIQKIPHGSRYSDDVVLPYLDNSMHAIDYGDTLLITDDEFQADYRGDTTSGYASNEPHYQCGGCGCRLGEDETYSSEGGDGTYCEECYNERYVQAIGRRGYEVECARDDVIQCESDGRYYVRDYSHDNDVYLCEITENWYKVDDLVGTSRGFVWCDYSEVVALDHEDTDGNRYALDEDTVTLHDGTRAHEDSVSKASNGEWVLDDDLDAYEAELTDAQEELTSDTDTVTEGETV
jgi:hypothetical protein